MVCLILTVIATAFSTRISFVLVVTSLVTAATLGSWGTFRQVKARRAQEASEGVVVALRAGVGPGPRPDMSERCIAVLATGRRCANRHVDEAFCRNHAPLAAKPKRNA